MRRASQKRELTLLLLGSSGKLVFLVHKFWRPAAEVRSVQYLACSVTIGGFSRDHLVDGQLTHLCTQLFVCWLLTELRCIHLSIQ